MLLNTFLHNGSLESNAFYYSYLHYFAYTTGFADYFSRSVLKRLMSAVVRLRWIVYAHDTYRDVFYCSPRCTALLRWQFWLFFAWCSLHMTKESFRYILYVLASSDDAAQLIYALVYIFHVCYNVILVCIAVLPSYTCPQLLANRPTNSIYRLQHSETETETETSPVKCLYMLLK